jgi:hypothetical protein
MLRDVIAVYPRPDFQLDIAPETLYDDSHPIDSIQD